MALPIYLAMTAWEYENCSSLPEHPGWMACHFSSYGDGLCNFPAVFPADGLLMVNDQIPPADHDPDLIAKQLLLCVDTLSPKGVVLDFQRPYCEKLQEVADAVLSALPCPVAITESYSQSWNGSIFLPPIPVDKKIAEYLQKWSGRDIWLEVTKAGENLVLTKGGCHRMPLEPLPERAVFQDAPLFCHYCTHVTGEQAIFSLWRTDTDLASMLECAEAFGVSTAIGLYQEFSAISGERLL